jgi:hypothetical protein
MRKHITAENREVATYKVANARIQKNGTYSAFFWTPCATCQYRHECGEGWNAGPHCGDIDGFTAEDVAAARDGVLTEHAEHEIELGLGPIVHY